MRKCPLNNDGNASPRDRLKKTVKEDMVRLR